MQKNLELSNEIIAESSSSLIKQLIKNKENWKVHSIFKNGVNIDDGDNLVFIGNNHNGCNPFHIVINNSLINITLNSKVIVDDKTIVVGENIILMGDIIFNSKVSYDDIYDDNSYLTLLNKIQKLEIMSGFDMTVSNILINAKEDIYLKKLLNNDESAFEYFIGRGCGLTPAGDDLIVGYLLAANYFKKQNNYKNYLNKLLKDSQITTRISHEFIKYANEGYFDLDLITLMNNLNQDEIIISQCINTIINHGSTSGCDVLIGIALFLQSIEYKEEIN